MSALGGLVGEQFGEPAAGHLHVNDHVAQRVEDFLFLAPGRSAPGQRHDDG